MSVYVIHITTVTAYLISKVQSIVTLYKTLMDILYPTFTEDTAALSLKCSSQHLQTDLRYKKKVCWLPGLLRFLLLHSHLLQQAPNVRLQRLTLCLARPGVRKLHLDDVVAKRAGVATLAAKCRGEEQTPRKIGANQSHIKMRKPSKTIEILMLTFCKPNHDSHLPFRLKIGRAHV